jgi:N-methylhydantoinase A/oxoprolinase/acetone carboxylase beta subunit
MHERRYGYADPVRAVELVSVRSRFVGLVTKPKLPKASRVRGRATPLEWKDVWIDGRKLKTAIYDRAALGYGHVVHGPAVIGEYSSTTLVPPDCVVKVDSRLNLVLTAGAE